MKQVLTSLKNKYVNNEKMFIRTLLISEGFGFCFSLSCVCGYSLDKFGTLFAGWGEILVNILLTILGAQIVAALILVAEIYVLNGPEETPGTDHRRNIKSEFKICAVWAIAAVIIFALWLPVYLAYFPSVFSYDAEAQLSQVISGNYSTHHPLLHTLIMGWCMKLMYHHGGINAGMALYSGLQMLIMAVICGWAVSEMYRQHSSRAGMIIYTAFIGIFPVNGILAVSTTKDVYFSGLVLIFVLLLRRYLSGTPEGDGNIHRSSLSLLIKIGITTVMMLLFRNNAGYALGLFCLLIAVFGTGKTHTDRGELKRERPWLLICTLVGALAVATLAGAGLKTALKAESGSPREALSIPIQQIARTAALHGNEMDPDLKAAVEHILDGEGVSKYDEHLADPVKERISMKDPGAFVKTWIRLGLRYPGTYIDAWLLTTEGAWYVADRSCDRIYGEGSDTGFGYLSTDIRTMPEGFQVTDESLLPGLRRALESLVSDNSFENIPVIRLIFAPSLYFWILMLYVSICGIRRSGHPVPVLFLFCIYLTILMGPAILIRYMYPYMLALCLPLMEMRRKNNGHS